MRRAAAAAGLAAAALLAGVAAPACEEEEAPIGPPRCEPASELLLERGLKQGFRGLAEGHPDEARAAFEAVLADEPGHPEARAGLRLLRDGPAERPAPPRGHLVLAGREVPAALPVDAARYRIEELRAQRLLARELGLPEGERPVPAYYRERRDDAGAPIPADDAEAVARRVDLVVLHDSQSETARAAFLTLASTGGSTHFLVDWDGRVYQTLDLAFEATHSGDAAIDARSVAIDLVNPVTLDRPPLPEAAVAAGATRPLSAFAVIHGAEVQQWGYTREQIASLHALVRALVERFPELPPRVPGGPGRVPLAVLPERGRDAVGVVGHLHLSPRALDPGPGFDWDALDRAIR